MELAVYERSQFRTLVASTQKSYVGAYAQLRKIEEVAKSAVINIRPDEIASFKILATEANKNIDYVLKCYMADMVISQNR